MTEIEKLLDRQARWQRERRHLSWAEKVRIAEFLQDSVGSFRAFFAGFTGVEGKRGGLRDLNCGFYLLLRPL